MKFNGICDRKVSDVQNVQQIKLLNFVFIHPLLQKGILVTLFFNDLQKWLSTVIPLSIFCQWVSFSKSFVCSGVMYSERMVEVLTPLGWAADLSTHESGSFIAFCLSETKQ